LLKDADIFYRVLRGRPRKIKTGFCEKKEFKFLANETDAEAAQIFLQIYGYVLVKRKIVYFAEKNTIFTDERYLPESRYFL
jgi:hypothetical protein